MAKSPHTPEWRAMVAKEYLDGKASSPDCYQTFYNKLIFNFSCNIKEVPV